MSYNTDMRKSVSGFTIVELLIVIVVIAVLAAITVVAYNGIQNRAADASVQSDLSNLAKKMNIAKIDSATSAYPYGNPAISTAIGAVKVNKNAYISTPGASYNLLVCYPTATDPTEFTIHGYSKSGKRFYADTNGRITEYTGATSWAGGAANTICASINAAWIAGGAGYSSGDTTTGPWRDWAGGN